MQTIKYCSSEFLNLLKANFETDYQDIYKKRDKDKIIELFNNELVYDGDLKFDYKPLMLRSDSNRGEYISANVKILYDSLKSLSNVQATKEELWFTLINTIYLDYLIDSIAVLEKSGNFEKQLSNLLFFNKGISRGMIVQSISKFWWIGYRTYDRNAEDPYWLTEYFCRTDASGKAVTFFGSRLTSNLNFSLGIIEAVKSAEEEGLVKNQKETYSFINEYFNFVGGVKILDIMSREEIVFESKRVLHELSVNNLSTSEKNRKKILVNP
ncbi:DUF6339 family protein [Macrococcus bovicus]|uniref:DUF6339 family protein n=1 Tax=Macrococcus bovicus TaxID=69968 RepID=UPI0025A648D3|nr:DUF6339 family protein [Macrococcus bovicus]WJP97267.1 DUF6339 family protein [Macrococcus bovicus]